MAAAKKNPFAALGARVGESATPKVPAAFAPPSVGPQTASTGPSPTAQHAALAAFAAANPPSATTVAPLPIDPVYAQTVGNNNQNETDTDTGLINTRNQGLLNLGYTASFDPNDPFALTAGSLAYDPNNPFSQATLLRTHYAQAQNAATNGLASQGQLYSGAEQNAQGYATTNFQLGDNTLQNSAGTLIGNAIQGHKTNIDSTNSANTSALGTSIAGQQPAATPSATTTTTPAPVVQTPSSLGKLVGKAAPKPKTAAQILAKLGTTVGKAR